MPGTLDILNAIADPIRLKMLKAMACCPAENQVSTQVCAKSLEISQPTLSHHFKTLLAAGVIAETKTGTKKFYHLNRQLLAENGIDIERVLAQKMSPQKKG